MHSNICQPGPGAVTDCSVCVMQCVCDEVQGQSCVEFLSCGDRVELSPPSARFVTY
jgi:hypothetical protein|eukprot:COSAG01_NODE_1938_length_8848_cov_17.798377_14_plen_56_part_00